MSWDTSGRHWYLNFQRVKFEEHDALRLVPYLPWGIELWEYDLQSRVYTQSRGKETSVNGRNIKITAKKDVKCAEEAWQMIRAKMKACAQHVATLTWQEVNLSGTLNET